MNMKKWFFVLLLVLPCVSGWCQSEKYQLTETGWGRIEKSYQNGILTNLGEINIPRWRKASGSMTIDFDKKEAVLTQRGKADKTFTLLSETSPKETRDGWTYVEYMALDGNNSVCHFWICRHESGRQRLLTLYPWSRPDTVYGYNFDPEE